MKNYGKKDPFKAPATRVSIDELLKSKTSMLGANMLPAGYGDVSTDDDVRDLLTKVEDKRVARVTIVWDNAMDNFPLEDVLDHMRETGAAMVIKTEEVKP